jgi:GcrA cell cycle regulator
MNFHVQPSDWTDERVALLKSLFPQGKSSSMLAREINERTRSTFTRNAVIGKLGRLGLTRPKEVTKREPRKSRRYHGTSNHTGRWHGGPSLPGEPVPPPVIFTEEHKCSLFDLTNKTCRFPLWDGDAGFSDKWFCGSPGANLEEGLPYCPGHTALASSGVAVTIGLKRKPKHSAAA